VGYARLTEQQDLTARRKGLTPPRQASYQVSLAPVPPARHSTTCQLRNDNDHDGPAPRSPRRLLTDSIVPPGVMHRPLENSVHSTDALMRLTSSHSNWHIPDQAWEVRPDSLSAEQCPGSVGDKFGALLWHPVAAVLDDLEGQVNPWASIPSSTATEM
jgi:hypothetical protein